MTGLPEDRKRFLMRAIKKLVVVYDECSDDSFNLNQAYRDGGANPYYYQTADGLFLQFVYAVPSNLWTPWGLYRFGASQEFEVDLERFMSRLVVEQQTWFKKDAIGFKGPLFALLSIDGERLPEPKLRSKEAYLGYYTAKREWDRLHDQ